MYIELLALNYNLRFQCHRDRDQSLVNAARDNSDLNRAKSIRGSGTTKTSSRHQVAAAENKTLLKGAETKHLKGNDKVLKY